MRTSSVPLPIMVDDSNDDARLLYCPFCRECYEGETECPMHELRLVDFLDLPKQEHERKLPGWDEELDPWDIRFGRGPMALGVFIVVTGFFLPFASATVDDIETTWSALDLALGPARSLWTVPFTAAIFVMLLVRRRTPVQMLGARLVGFVLTFMPAISVGSAMVNMNRGIERLNGGGIIEWNLGIVVILVGCGLLMIGSVRFGAMPRDGLPHGAGPEADEKAIDVEEG